MNQTIRIIGGKYRGKKLHFPSSEGLRPTPDRVRETVFNWLMHDIRDVRCLDAFAGSGALGFEAHSRGAAYVLMLEQDSNVYSNLAKTALSFNSTDVVVKKIDACKFLQESNESFDLVFLDPPFAKDYLPGCIERLSNSTLLKAGGLLYIESPQEVEMDFAIWQQIKLKHAGQITYGLYKKIKEG